MARKRYQPTREMIAQENAFIEDLRGIVRNTREPWKDIAAKARITPKTVSRFVYRETKRPTFHTILRLMHACDVRLKVVYIRSTEKV